MNTTSQVLTLLPRLFFLSGEQGAAWKHIELQVVREHAPSATNISIAFVATRGPGFLGDIAIDDVDVVSRPCSADQGGDLKYTANKRQGVFDNGHRSFMQM